jgi:hypothetical protein
VVILNLGGEGEDPEAIDINLLVRGGTLRPLRLILRPGWLIQGDFRKMPIRSAAVDEVRGHMVPLLLSAGHHHLLAGEAFRVLRQGGRFRVSPTLPADVLLPALSAAGFHAVRLVGGSATGVKP